MAELPIIEMAKKIDRQYREKILEENLIYKAIAVSYDPQMRVLFVVWKNYIEPNNTSLDINCTFCLKNILDAFKAMEPVFIELIQNENLLDL